MFGCYALQCGFLDSYLFNTAQENLTVVNPDAALLLNVPKQGSKFYCNFIGLVMEWFKLILVLSEVGNSAKGFCELAGRVEPVLGDVVMALINMGKFFQTNFQSYNF